MYIIRNKIRVICSKIRVGMEGGGSIFPRGGGPYFTGEYGTPGPYSMGVHIRSHTGLTTTLGLRLSKDYTNLDVPITIYLCRPYMFINALGPIKTCI